MSSVQTSKQKPKEWRPKPGTAASRVKIRAAAPYLTVSRNSKRLSRARLREAFSSTHVIETTAGWLVARFDLRGIKKEFPSKDEALKYACRISAPKDWTVVLHKRKIDRDRFFDPDRAKEWHTRVDP